MKTHAVQSKVIEANRQVWNKIFEKLAKQVMQDWIIEKKDVLNQEVQPVSLVTTDRKSIAQNSV